MDKDEYIKIDAAELISQFSVTNKDQLKAYIKDIYDVKLLFIQNNT